MDHTPPRRQAIGVIVGIAVIYLVGFTGRWWPYRGLADADEIPAFLGPRSALSCVVVGVPKGSEDRSVLSGLPALELVFSGRRYRAYHWPPAR